MKELESDGPIEKYIILLKLTEILGNAPDFAEKLSLDPVTHQRQWLSKVRALLARLDISKEIAFDKAFRELGKYWKPAILLIKGKVLDAIEEIKLELELDGRSEIGSVYAPGDVYQFYADLKEVVNSATTDVLIVDPYFNGEAFDAYLSTVGSKLNIQILADSYSKDISAYIKKYKSQYGTNIKLRRSKELHDRVIFIDNDVAWIMGGSIKDAGKKATCLIPLQPQFFSAKHKIYLEIWDRATEVECSF